MANPFRLKIHSFVNNIFSKTKMHVALVYFPNKSIGSIKNLLARFQISAKYSRTLLVWRGVGGGDHFHPPPPTTLVKQAPVWLDSDVDMSGFEAEGKCLAKVWKSRNIPSSVYTCCRLTRWGCRIRSTKILQQCCCTDNDDVTMWVPYNTHRRLRTYITRCTLDNRVTGRVNSVRRRKQRFVSM